MKKINAAFTVGSALAALGCRFFGSGEAVKQDPGPLYIEPRKLLRKSRTRRLERNRCREKSAHGCFELSARRR
jgi:hypothetical protein